MTGVVSRAIPAAILVIVATTLYGLPVRAAEALSVWQFALSVLSNPLYLTYFVLPAGLAGAILLSPRLLFAPHLLAAGSSLSLVCHWLRRFGTIIIELSGVATATLLASSIGLALSGPEFLDLPLARVLPPSLALIAQLLVTDAALIGLTAIIAAIVRLTGRVAPAAGLAILVWLSMAASTNGLTPAWLSPARLFDAGAPLPTVGLLVLATGILLVGSHVQRRSAS